MYKFSLSSIRTEERCINEFERDHICLEDSNPRKDFPKSTSTPKIVEEIHNMIFEDLAM